MPPAGTWRASTGVRLVTVIPVTRLAKRCVDLGTPVAAREAFGARADRAGGSTLASLWNLWARHVPFGSPFVGR